MKPISLLTLILVFFAVAPCAPQSAATPIYYEQIGADVNGLFKQLFILESEKRLAAQKHWNVMSKEEKGRFIVSMQTQTSFIRAKEMSKSEAEREADEAESRMSPEQWRDTISSYSHIELEERRAFNERENDLLAELAAIGKPAFHLLIKRLTLPPGHRSAASWKEQEWARRALIKIGAPAILDLMLVVRDKDMRATAFAIDALGNIKAKEAVDLLIERLSDDDGRIRGAAAQALSEIADPKAMGPLTKALQDDNYQARRAAVMGLEKFGDASCLEILAKAKQAETSAGKGNLRRLMDEAIEAIKARNP